MLLAHCPLIPVIKSPPQKKNEGKTSIRYIPQLIIIDYSLLNEDMHLDPTIYIYIYSSLQA
jgi:hypothetical protein